MQQQLTLRSLATLAQVPACHWLKELRSVKLLRLESTLLGDKGMHTIAEAAKAGALSSLQELHLSNNAINHGLASLTDSLTGSLALLRELWLDGNEVSDDSLAIFTKNLSEGSLPCLEDLYLSGNRISCLLGSRPSRPLSGAQACHAHCSSSTWRETALETKGLQHSPQPLSSQACWRS